MGSTLNELDNSSIHMISNLGGSHLLKSQEGSKKDLKSQYSKIS